MKTIKLDPAKCIPGGPYRTITKLPGQTLTVEESQAINHSAGKTHHPDGSVSYFVPIKEESIPRKKASEPPAD